jgi:hypothetical protein
VTTESSGSHLPGATWYGCPDTLPSLSGDPLWVTPAGCHQYHFDKVTVEYYTCRELLW